MKSFFAGRLLSLTMLVFFLVGFGVSCRDVSSSSASAGQMAKVLADFQAENSPAKDIKMLENLLKAKNGGIFFFLLMKSEGKDLIVFKKAFASSGNLDALLSFGPFLSREMKVFINGPGTVETRQAAANFCLQSFNQRLGSFASEIAVVARKNQKELVAIIKNVYVKGDTNNAEKASGAIIGLQAMGEDGFEALLNSVESEDDQSMIFALSELLGPSVVIPTLKAFEDPSSSEIKRKTASLTIFSFSKNNGLVIDKVVEAIKHGRYFESNVGKKNEKGEIVISSIEDAMKMATGWWGNYLNSYYKGATPVAEYIAEKHLEDTSGQHSVIRFLAEIDFQTAQPYFLKLDMGKLSKKSIEALFSACHPPLSGLTLSRADNAYLQERCELFCQLFLKCPGERDNALYGVEKYPAEIMADFYIKNFASFSEEEKRTVIYNCGQKGYEGFPAEQRDRVFKSISPLCSKELKDMMVFYLERGASGF